MVGYARFLVSQNVCSDLTLLGEEPYAQLVCLLFSQFRPIDISSKGTVSGAIRKFVMPKRSNYFFFILPMLKLLLMLKLM